uniref:NADH-ubiquinone oxidoreductase chain 6 n=1 Tax=Tarentola mauritanica TaxID=8569 RepID=H9CX44_TARMA|nr:NADH dehydrogenase subunit 6 [Tarentola mauritanica]AFC39517.1 NADH dehydrogenase subunit 6 [Tarentola mauritanica]AFC39530.1 NADH dehydrogenase subunit 6 [Tarentola mauritanica]AFC39543.1 NADH dehydrogenase subunit 6 [Tarentola mauritanica]AFC39556.1 NADH dehydrogenase subunit 6 [Tarentola mauritanica]
MLYFVIFFSFLCLLLGGVGVASNPSPFYGVVGLVFGALAGCVALVGLGGSFIGLVLFIVYLGGMLVVFAYSVALAAEPHPEASGGTILWWVLCYVVFVLVLGGALMEVVGLGGVGVSGADCYGGYHLRLDSCGAVLMYFWGWGLLLLCGWALLLVLFVVLELVRELGRGGLRVPEGSW